MFQIRSIPKGNNQDRILLPLHKSPERKNIVTAATISVQKSEKDLSGSNTSTIQAERILSTKTKKSNPSTSTALPSTSVPSNLNMSLPDAKLEYMINNWMFAQSANHEIRLTFKKTPYLKNSCLIIEMSYYC